MPAAELIRSMSIHPSPCRLLLEAIDHAKTAHHQSWHQRVIVWADSTDDTSTSLATVHLVSSFMDGVSKATFASLPNPTDTASSTISPNLSLFGAGPTDNDVNQGSITDSFLMAPLAALAKAEPIMIRNSVVDMGDGTYAVQFFGSSGKPEFVRVSDVFGAGSHDGYFGASIPARSILSGNLVMEKALCLLRYESRAPMPPSFRVHRPQSLPTLA